MMNVLELVDVIEVSPAELKKSTKNPTPAPTKPKAVKKPAPKKTEKTEKKPTTKKG